MKQLTIGTKSPIYYENYLAHATCYQDGTESVNQALDVSGKGNHLNLGANLSEGTAWATPGQLATTYSNGSGFTGAQLPAAVFNTVNFEAGDYFIFACHIQATNPAPTLPLLMQGHAANRCGIRFSLKTDGKVSPSIWTPSGQHNGADLQTALGEAAPTAWSGYGLVIGGKSGAAINYIQARNGAADAAVFRQITGVGDMSLARTDGLYVASAIFGTTGYGVATKLRHIHAVRIPAAVASAMTFARAAAILQRLWQSPALPIQARELGL